MSDDYATRRQPLPAAQIDVTECLCAMLLRGPATDLDVRIADDLLARSAVGLATYGTTLKTHNGRSALVDAYQEALDLPKYLMQDALERDPSLGESGAWPDDVAIALGLAARIRRRLEAAEGQPAAATRAA